MSAEAQLINLGITLPPAPKPIGLYKPMLIVGDLIYMSGHGPLNPDGTLHVGRVGDNLTLEQGQAAARQTGLALLATLRANLGSLDKIKSVVKLLGLVRCIDDFTQQPAVINGCSQLFVDVFGSDHGIGVRSAIGTNALPAGMAVEIEAIFSLKV